MTTGRRLAAGVAAVALVAVAAGPGAAQVPPAGASATPAVATPSPEWAWGTWATPSCEDPAFVSFGTDQVVVARDREGKVWAFAKEAFSPAGPEWTRVRYGSGLAGQVQLARPLPEGRLQIADRVGGQPLGDEEIAAGVDPVAAGPQTWRLTEWQRCASVPGTAALVHAEAAAVFESLRAVETGCAGEDEAACGAALLGAVDVSRDGHLSTAEVARVGRVVAYLAGIAPLMEGGEPTTEKELAGFLGVAMLVGPALAELLVKSLDYDADGRLSTAELAQDRAVLSLTDAARLDPLAGTAGLGRLIGQLRQLAPLLGALATRPRP